MSQTLSRSFRQRYRDPPAGPADLDPALLDLLNGDRVAYTSQEWSDVQQAIEGLSTSDTRIGRLQALRLLGKWEDNGAEHG